MQTRATTVLTCVDARERIRAFVESTDSIHERPALREHLARCADCEKAYRMLVEETARLSSAVRRSPLDVPVQRPRTNAASEERGRPRRISKRLVLAALVATLVATFFVPGSTRVVLRASDGDVKVGRDTIVAAAEGTAVTHGDVCATGAAGRARLELGAHAIEVEPYTTFVVQRSDRLAIQLLTGSARITGDVTLVTTRGVVEARGGHARVELGRDGLRLANEAGSLALIDSRGERRIAVGASTLLGPMTSSASPR